jgi:hypothetical protein
VKDFYRKLTAAHSKAAAHLSDGREEEKQQREKEERDGKLR